MRVCITGASGFLGFAIARQLRERGDQVVNFSRHAHERFSELGIEHHAGDLQNKPLLLQAVKNCDAVIHVAAKAGIWGSYASFYNVNVLGTRHVIDACLAQGISRLVYTSTPSVVYGDAPLSGVDECTPYPKRYLCHYAATKALAEQMVLSQDPKQLKTVALRPHLIWGPGDRHILPGLIKRARSGRLRLIDEGRAMIDHVFVDNAALAHVLALDRLDERLHGHAFFITQGQPCSVKSFLNDLLGAVGLPALECSISSGVAYGVASFVEWLYKLFRVSKEPPITRFLVKQLSTDHWFAIDAARQALGYEPKTSFEAGLAQLAQEYCDL